MGKNSLASSSALMGGYKERRPAVLTLTRHQSSINWESSRVATAMGGWTFFKAGGHNSARQKHYRKFLLFVLATVTQALKYDVITYTPIHHVKV